MGGVQIKNTMANNSGVWTDHSVYNPSVLPGVEVPLPVGESKIKVSSREMGGNNGSNNQQEMPLTRVMELASSGTHTIYSSHWTDSVPAQPVVHLTP